VAKFGPIRGRQRRSRAGCDDDGNLLVNQFLREYWQPTELVLRPAVFDHDVLALDIASFCQALAKRGQDACVLARCPGVEKPDHRQRRLLRARCERPRRRTAEQRDELAPLQWLNSIWLALAGSPRQHNRSARSRSGALLRCGNSIRLMSLVGQNENLPRSGLCQLPPATDICARKAATWTRSR
jgi:hypothetical protein